MKNTLTILVAATLMAGVLGAPAHAGFGLRIAGGPS